jgi:hypothetical protein
MARAARPGARVTADKPQFFNAASPSRCYCLEAHAQWRRHTPANTTSGGAGPARRVPAGRTVRTGGAPRHPPSRSHARRLTPNVRRRRPRRGAPRRAAACSRGPGAEIDTGCAHPGGRARDPGESARRARAGRREGSGPGSAIAGHPRSRSRTGKHFALWRRPDRESAAAVRTETSRDDCASSRGATAPAPPGSPPATPRARSS